MKNQRLYSFGYNAFQQTGKENKETVLKEPLCHTRIKAVLFASWESTIVLNDEDKIDIWGYKPNWFDKLKQICENKQIVSVFGDPEQLFGIIDEKNQVSFVNDTLEYTDWMEAKDVVYCKDQQALFCLETTGSVRRYCLGNNGWESLTLPTVIAIAASPSHVLFLTESYAPIYALGSNRFSQIGIDYHQQKVDEPTMIEYFCGLSNGTSIECGPFHSAVLLGGDLYTFGWSKDGRLGWGNSQNDSISLAVFLDVNDQPVEINSVKVACGAAHTLVLDDEGMIWSCGSNKYGQLGRSIQGEFDPYFRKCTAFNSSDERAIDCIAGHWDSFVSTVL